MLKKKKSTRPQSHMILLVIIALLMITIVSVASLPKGERNLSGMQGSLFSASYMYK